MSTPVRPVRVLHVITRMIVGGAQENTMLSCALIDPERFPSAILSGPETGLEGQLHDECRARGVDLRFLGTLVRRVAPLHDLVTLFRLVRIFRAGRYDVVHTHSSKAGIVGRLAAFMAGVPIVVHTVHGWGFNRRQSPRVFHSYVWLERLCARITHALVVVGAPDRDEGLALGIGRAEQYRLIRSGIEVETYRDVALGRAEARARIGLPADAFVVGSVARLSEQKAPLDAFASFVPLARAHAEAHLVLVGDGPLRPRVESAIAREGLEGRVHLLGLRRDVPELLRAFDVFLLASHWEGLPRVFPQAMAAGLPIVATRVAGAADAVLEGETGWLADAGDTATLAAALRRLADDPAAARAMGARGRARVEEFSASRMVRRLEGVYAALVAGTAPPPD